jgi:hypothetical protein
VILAATCILFTMFLVKPWRAKKQHPWGQNDLRRMRRFSDRVHADERLPHE